MVGPRQLYLPSISYSLSEMLCLNKHNGEYNYGFSIKNSIVIHVMTHRDYRRNIKGFTDCASCRFKLHLKKQKSDDIDE